MDKIDFKVKKFHPDLGKIEFLSVEDKNKFMEIVSNIVQLCNFKDRSEKINDYWRTGGWKRVAGSTSLIFSFSLTAKTYDLVQQHINIIPTNE